MDFPATPLCAVKDALEGRPSHFGGLGLGHGSVGPGYRQIGLMVISH